MTSEITLNNDNALVLKSKIILGVIISNTVASLEWNGRSLQCRGWGGGWSGKASVFDASIARLARHRSGYGYSKGVVKLL